MTTLDLIASPSYLFLTSGFCPTRLNNNTYELGWSEKFSYQLVLFISYDGEHDNSRYTQVDGEKETGREVQGVPVATTRDEG